MLNAEKNRFQKFRRKFFHREKDVTRPKVMNIVVFIVLALYCFTLLYPLFWAFLASLKENAEFMTLNRNGFPIEPTFNNYIKAFESMSVTGTSMFSMIFNSIWYSAIGAFLNVFVCSMTAYVLARYKFVGHNLLNGISILVIVLPIIGALPSQYKIYNLLGIAGSPLMLLTCVGGFGFNFIVLHAVYKSMAKDYMEAAFVEGAGHFGVFFRIMLPQAVGAMSALFIVMFIDRWNDYTTPLLFLKNTPTLSTGLYIYKTIMNRRVEMPVYFAGIFICCIPVVILYAFFQKRIMNISFGGGIKG